MMRALPLLLLLLQTSNGRTLTKICVKLGEIVALECPGPKSGVTWTIPRSCDPESLVRSPDGSLVLLNASDAQAGNYTCDMKKVFEVTVYTIPSSDCEKTILYPRSCNKGTSCTLYCPSANVPQARSNLTSVGVSWHKDNSLQGETFYFPSVTESDQGVYSCVRSFLYKGLIYKKTFKVQLDVKPAKRIKTEGIISPEPDEVFPVDVGSPLVINCTAKIFSTWDEVYWKIKNVSVSTSKSERIHSTETVSDRTKMTVSLVFKEVSEEDLSTVFTCKLESVSQESIPVHITLELKPRPSYVAVAIVGAVLPLVLIVVLVISITYKIHIALFFRDTLGFHRRVSDGKSFDACIMCYSEEEGGLSEDERRTLQNMLEDHFGYSLCLFDRDVLPGKAVSDAVLECVEQSRALVLVPASADHSPGSDLLSAVHEAVVERQSRLVFIRSRSAGVLPVPETLQLLTNRCVTWRGSFHPTSFFWKQLRYYLPPANQDPRVPLLPHNV